MRQISAGKVLLVDVGHRSPDASLGLRLPAETDVGHGLDGKQRAGGGASAIVGAELAVLAARDDGPLFVRERMMSFCSGAAQRFAWTFFDGATVDEGSMNGLVSAVDLIIVVVDAQDARRQVVRHTVETLQQRRNGLIGFVLNNQAYEIPEFIYERL
jgi:hypothetical protein